MYALTIKQPWIGMILSGEKTVEFRRWQPRRLTIGQIFALHEAGAGIVGVAGYAGAKTISLLNYPAAPLVDQPGCPAFGEVVAADDRRPWKAWWLAGVRRLPLVPCPGCQGLWQLPEDVERRVREQLEAETQPKGGETT